MGDTRFESIFRLRGNKTTIRTEAPTGLTTLLTTACIIFVNPDILSKAGIGLFLALIALQSREQFRIPAR